MKTAKVSVGQLKPNIDEVITECIEHVEYGSQLLFSILTTSLFINVNAKLYPLINDSDSHLLQESILNASKYPISYEKIDYTMEKKRMSTTKRWNGPTMDDLYLILRGSAKNSRLGSRMPRGDLRPSDDNSDYHPELWPLMPTLFSGFRGRAYDSVVD